LDDVGAGLQETPVDVADDLRLGQREEVAVVEQILLRVAKAIATDVRLAHPISADGGAHRAVDDRDPLPQQLAQRVVLVGILFVAVLVLVVAHRPFPGCALGLSPMASTTCKCGFLISREATSADWTTSPARVS